MSFVVMTDTSGNLPRQYVLDYSLEIIPFSYYIDGKEYKETRKVLLENLSGHTAFRTKADEEKWKARQAEKRQALRESKEMAAEENGAEE